MTNINDNAIRMVAVFGASLATAVLMGILDQLVDGIGSTLAMVLATLVAAALAIAIVDGLRRNRSPAQPAIREELVTEAMEVTSTTDRQKLIEAGLRLLIRQTAAKQQAALVGSDPNAQTIKRDHPLDFD